MKQTHTHTPNMLTEEELLISNVMNDENRIEKNCN